MFYELARDRHARQTEALTSLDTKLAFFLTSSAALLSVLVAVYALRPDSFHTFGLVLLAVSGLTSAFLTGIALHAFQHAKWKSGPKLPEVFDLHFSEDQERLKWRVANVFWHDYNFNKRHEDRKATALTVALVLFVIQTALLVGALLYVAVSQSSGSSRRSECPDRAGRDASAPVLLVLARGECLEAPVQAALARSLAFRSLTPYAAKATALDRISASDRRASIVRSA
jgi:hypothetical protein